MSIRLPRQTGILKINNGVSLILYDCKLPNKFHRLMAKLLLGWIYEEVGEQDEIDNCYKTD